MANYVDADARAAGLALRRQMFGPQGAEPALENASEFKRPLEEFVTDVCFGTAWQREGLDAKTRSLLTIAVLTALGRAPQMRFHVRGAIANGATKEEIREVILHVMIYAGLPFAVDATLTAEEVLNEME